jgi:mRNA interferase RelE/StbE
MYKLELSATAYRILKSGKLQPKDNAAVKNRILSLQNDPRSPGCGKLKGFDKNYYRVRQGNYRVVYEIKDTEKIVVIVYVGHRRDVYRKLG